LTAFRLLFLLLLLLLWSVMTVGVAMGVSRHGAWCAAVQMVSAKLVQPAHLPIKRPTTCTSCKYKCRIIMQPQQQVRAHNTTSPIPFSETGAQCMSAGFIYHMRGVT
jgi:hypothetical protein